MKTVNTKKRTILLFITCIMLSFSMSSQVGGWKAELVSDSKNALDKMIEKTPKLKVYKDKAYGYAVFPKVTSGAIGIGGAAGQGIVYKGDTMVGSAKLKAVSIGFSLGGQQFSEVVFFENQSAYEDFINGKLKFDAKASAVAISPEYGASADVAYKDGVAVFSQSSGGLMYEASLGGQHFKFTAK